MRSLALLLLDLGRMNGLGIFNCTLLVRLSFINGNFIPPKRSTVEELVSLIGEMPKNKNYHLVENKEDHFNIIRRCQKIVRETKAAKKLSDEDQNSLANALMGCGRPTETKKVNQMDLTEIKEEVLESVRGLRDDIETHIGKIMMYGQSGLIWLGALLN